MNSSVFRLTLSALLGMALLVFACQAGAAGVYKWTDADGGVHFSDQPVDPDAAERIDLRSHTPASPATSERRPPPPGPTTEAVTDDDEIARQQAQVREANCRIARDTHEHNSNIHRMYRLDDNGERVFLTDEERAELLQRSRDDVARWCDNQS